MPSAVSLPATTPHCRPSVTYPLPASLCLHHWSLCSSMCRINAAGRLLISVFSPYLCCCRLAAAFWNNLPFSSTIIPSHHGLCSWPSPPPATTAASPSSLYLPTSLLSVCLSLNYVLNKLQMEDHTQPFCLSPLEHLHMLGDAAGPTRLLLLVPYLTIHHLLPTALLIPFLGGVYWVLAFQMERFALTPHLPPQLHSWILWSLLHTCHVRRGHSVYTLFTYLAQHTTSCFMGFLLPTSSHLTVSPLLLPILFVGFGPPYWAWPASLPASCQPLPPVLGSSL